MSKEVLVLSMIAKSAQLAEKANMEMDKLLSSPIEAGDNAVRDALEEAKESCVKLHEVCTDSLAHIMAGDFLKASYPHTIKLEAATHRRMQPRQRAN